MFKLWKSYSLNHLWVAHFYFAIYSTGLFYLIIVLLFIVKNKMYYKFTICEKLSRAKKYMSCKTLQNHEHLFMGMADKQ